MSQICYLQVSLDANALALILFGVSLGNVVAYSLGFSDNYSSTCVVEQSTYTSPCGNIGFSSNIELSAALIMDAVIEWFLLVGG